MPKRRSPAKRTSKRRSPAKRTSKRRSPAKRTSKKRSPAKRTSVKRSPAKRTSVKRSPKTSSSGGWPMKFVDTISDPNNLMGKPSIFKRTDKYIIYDIPRQYSGMKDEQLYERMKNMSREEAWNEFKKFKEEQAEIDRQIRQREDYLDSRYGGLDW